MGKTKCLSPGDEGLRIIEMSICYVLCIVFYILCLY